MTEPTAPPKVPTPLSVLAEAEQIVGGSRSSDYGDAVQSFARISTIATMASGKHISAIDCCKVLMAVKMVRESYKPKRDNRVDLAGYTLILDALVQAEAAPVSA